MLNILKITHPPEFSPLTMLSLPDADLCWRKDSALQVFENF